MKTVSAFAKASASRGRCEPDAGSTAENIPSELWTELTVGSTGRSPLDEPHMLVCRNGWSHDSFALVPFRDGSFFS